MKNKKAALLGMAICCTLTAAAQSMAKYEGFSFDKNSPDGKWLVQNYQGTSTVYHTTTDEVFTIGDGIASDMFSPGLGQSVTNSGKVCGYSMSYAFLWHDEVVSTVEVLPQPTGVGSMFNGAQGFTPDESRIVGALGSKGASLTADGLMCYPVYWDRLSSGTYELHTLPYQAKDFSGGTPQSVITQCVSDDGKTIVGTLVNWTGRYKFPIVFKEDGEGNWTWQLLGKSEVYEESRMSELPELSAEPTEPDYTQYMTTADLTNYNTAIGLYEDSLTSYESGLIDVLPSYPVVGDFISDSTQLADYTLAAQQYVAQHAKWLNEWKAYSEALSQITTGASFRQNNLWLSPSGRYLATSLNDASQNTVPGYFDLSEEEPAFHRYAYGEEQSMIATGILDDGTLFAASPASELTRSTVVFPKDAEAPLTFHDYLAELSTDAAKWLADNHTYSVEGEDSIISGTVHVSDEGRVFVGYYSDYYSDNAAGDGISYVINFNDSQQGINALAADSRSAATGIYDLQGRRIANDSQSAKRPGLYIERKDGATRKVIIR